MEREITKIRVPTDVTEAHIQEAADMREGLYGDRRLPWEEVIDRLEGYTEDWGDQMDSPAIRYLQQQVRRELRGRT